MTRKVSLLVLVAGLAWAITAPAQAPYTEFKVGKFNPKAVKSGYLFGVHLGRMIDESLSWGLEINYFQRNYRKDVEIATEFTRGGTKPETKMRLLEFTTHIVPLLLKLNYEHPIAYGAPFYVRASAGGGWEMVWNSENNYEEGIKDNRFYSGFGWQVSAGLGIAISSSGNLFFDVFYNNSRVKRNQNVVKNLPVWEELDISGLGVKLGVSIVGFGW